MRYPLYKSGRHKEALDDPEALRQRELGSVLRVCVPV